MKIDTDDWTTLSDVIAETGVPQKTVYRIVDRLDIGEWIFGVRCVRKTDVPRIVEARSPTKGNPTWVIDGDAAAAAAILAVESRKKRVAERGLTEAEKLRNKKLADHGRKRAKVKDTPQQSS